eukprot:4569123-Pyramimonas_sp.AAC.1
MIWRDHQQHHQHHQHQHHQQHQHHHLTGQPCTIRTPALSIPRYTSTAPNRSPSRIKSLLVAPPQHY